MSTSPDPGLNLGFGGAAAGGPAPDRSDAPRPKAGILDIAPYVAGKAKAAGHEHPRKLSANENVLGCSPLAQAAYAEAGSRLNLYPDGRSEVLRTAIAGRFGVEAERLILGCGSDEVFTLLCQTFLEPGDNAVQNQFGFFAYRIAIRAAQGQVRFAPQPDRRIDVDRMLEQVDARTRLVFLDNPGNPTGAWLKAAEVERLHAALPPNVILVLDGAYAEFVDDPEYADGLRMARNAPNVVVTRTFSKIYGLAGLRVGWGYGPEAVISAMERIKAPFNVNLPAQSALLGALEDEAFIAQSQALVRRWRPWLAQQLGGLGLEVFPSQGNFVLAAFPPGAAATAAQAEARLADRGVLVRGLANYGMHDALRITIGAEADNRAVVEALGGLLGEVGGG